MKTTLKRTLAFLLCAALLCGFAVMPQANAQTPQADTQMDLARFGENVIYGEAGETTYVPAGYTYIYESANGQVFTRQAEQDIYVSNRVLTAQEAEALAELEYGQENYTVDGNGQTLIRREFNAKEAAAYSDAVEAILNGAEVEDGDQVSLLCEAYSSRTPVRALITFEDKPVIRTEGMSVSLGGTLGQAELQAVSSIEARQLSVMDKAEKSLGYDIEINNQFALLTNAVSATVNYGDLAAISQMDGIKSAILMPSFSVPEINSVTSDSIEFKPNMKYAGPGMGSNQAWDLGYKGEGMSVAIIDTGLSFSNPAFSIEPTDPDTVAYSKEDVAAILDAKELHAETLAADTSIDTVYYSSKVPFGFNYGDGMADYGTDSTWMGHGSHVAGIVAGNLPEAAKEQFQMDSLGIAPEAQLIIMKVFDRNGECYLDYLVSAMEDAIALGVDCANLSLGVPSGPAYLEEVTEVYDAAVAAGINVVVSAGNDAHSGMNSLWGDNLVKSDTVSTGTVGMPGTFDSVLTVASAENSHQISFYTNALAWYNERMGVRQMVLYEELDGVPEGKGFTENLIGGDYAFTNSLDDAEGKLLFLPFEGGNADSLIVAAAEAGAAGLVLAGRERTPENGMTYVDATATRFDVPTCVSDIGQYNWMVAANPPGGLIRVEDRWNPSFYAGEMSSFSSWGPTEGLTLKPEITGIGGNVFSAYFGSNFAVSSGTSMASPAVAASAALLRQYLRENALVSEDELGHVVNCLLMSTATPIFDEDHGIYYFVRRQGAGLANIGSAIASNAYITVEGTNKAKLELGDDPEKTGVYEMTFEVVNLSDTDKTYSLDVTILGQKADGGLLKNGKVTYLTYDYARTLEATVSTNLENESITVPANGTATVTVTVALSDDEKEYYDERFPAGAYVEGFIQLLSEETPNLTVPFLGFYGDFDQAPVLEDGTYETILAGYQSFSIADQFHTSIWGFERVSEDPDNFLTRLHYLGDTNSGFVKVSKDVYDQLSMRTWATEFYSEQAGFSPNNDSNLDFFRMGIALRRNVDNIHYTVTNRDTGEVIWEQDTGFVNKTFSKDVYAGNEMSLEWLFPMNTYGQYDLTQCLLENNTWIEIRADVTPEGAATATESQSFTVYVDNDEPVPAESFTFFTDVTSWGPDWPPSYLYTFRTEIAEQWFMDYSDEIILQYNEEIGVWEGFDFSTIYVGTDTPLRGQSNGVENAYYPFSANSKYLALYHDYAGNTSVHEVSGGEYLLDYVDLKADETQIMLGETLTIKNTATAPFNTILNWEVSDPTVAEIVETADHSVTIKGIAKGSITVSGGFGEYMDGIEITVVDPAYEAIKTQFVDIQNHWAKDDIVEAIYQGLFKGMDDTHFAPNADMTRGQLVTVLYRMEGEPETATAATFKDVPASAYYADAVAWAAENEIVTGLSAEVFAPKDSTTREQLATILYRYATYKGLDVSARADLSAYADGAAVSDYAEEALSWAVAAGLIKGVTDTTLAPKGTATRAQVATILVRYQAAFKS